jgi:hypothetical protein
MSWLAEDPWPLAGTFLVLALGFLIALRFTQQGKFLIYAGAAFLLALFILLVEFLWVTDAERIEAVVLNVVHGVEREDPEAVLNEMAPDLTLAVGGISARSGRFQETLRGYLEATRFDFIHLNQLKIHVGRLARAGTADFTVTTSGTFTGDAPQPFAATTDWQFGLREVSPGIWKINRISAVRLPRGYIPPPLQGN